MLDALLEGPGMMPSDKGLCTELFYGTLRRYLRLEWFVNRFLRKPEGLPSEMRRALLLALYELAFLRTPPHAPVHWTVEHLQHRFGQGLAKVANGALRAMQRALPEFRNPAAEAFASREEYLACLYGAPLWIVLLWQRAYGEQDAEALLRASCETPPSGLRINRARPDWRETRTALLQEFAGVAVTPMGEAMLVCDGPMPPQARVLLREGRASRQSAASLEALESMDPSLWPQPIWDCCAGRGGKSLALLEMGLPVALASDPSEARLAALPGEYARLGLSIPPCPAMCVASATSLFAESPASEGAAVNPAPPESSLPRRFGTVLVDAPCSGLGTLARRPEIRLRRTEADIAALVRVQREVLDAAAAVLNPGGSIVYLTCTRSPAENEEQVAAFLERHPGALLEKEYQTPAVSPLREFFYATRLRLP